MYARIKKWYAEGAWPLSWVRNAVVKGKITKEEYREITGAEYDD